MMTEKNINATQQKERTAAAPIPLPTYHIPRTHSELQLAQDQLLADYQDGKMYERILIGILRRCDETGICHPKTSSSLENIINTKMQDFRSLSWREIVDDDDRFDDDQSQHMHRSFPERELSSQRLSFTSLTSSEIESLRKNSSTSSLSCLTSTTDGSTEATHDIDSGIFELEL